MIILIVSISLLVTFFWLYLASKSIYVFNVEKLNMISFLFYKDIVIMSFLGILLVFFKFDINNHLYFWAITGIVSDTSRNLGYWSFHLSMILMFSGMILANIVLIKRINSKQFFHNYIHKDVQPFYSVKDSSIFYSLVLFLIIVAFSILYILMQTEKIPLLLLFKGASPLDIAIARSSSKFGGGSNTFIRDIIAKRLTHILSYICYAYYKMNKNFKYKILTILSFILSFIILTYNLEKMPFLIFLVGLLVIQVQIYGKISLKKIILFGTIVFLSLIVMFFFVMGSEDITSSIIKIFSRTFVAQTAAIFLSFEYFPDNINFIGFSGISNQLSSILNEDYQMYGRLIFSQYNPVAFTRGDAGTIVGLFLAESWALFGIWGIILLPIIVGFFIQSIHLFISKLPKTPASIGLYGFLTVNWSLTGGVSHFLNPKVLVINLTFVLLMTMFALFLKISAGKTEGI